MASRLSLANVCAADGLLFGGQASALDFINQSGAVLEGSAQKCGIPSERQAGEYSTEPSWL